MQNLLLTISLGLLFTLLGAFLSWIINDPDRVPQWIALSKLNWDGEWWCIWQNPEDKNGLNVDKVQLNQKWGKLKIKVIKAGSKHNWEGIGTLKATYFTGDWMSVRAHAHSRGTFAYKVLPGGEHMVGYFIGPDKEGRLVCPEAIITSDRKFVNEVEQAYQSMKPNKSLHRTFDKMSVIKLSQT